MVAMDQVQQSRYPLMSDCDLGTTGRGPCVHCGFTADINDPLPIRHTCPKKPSEGLGDTIAKVTTAIGIKPCKGCKKRQAKLNKLFPYR